MIPRNCKLVCFFVIIKEETLVQPWDCHILSDIGRLYSLILFE